MILFGVAFLTGFITPIPVKIEILGDLKASLEPYATLPPVKMFTFVLFNNSVKTFIVLVLGILFGVLPLIVVVTDEYILEVAYLFASGEVGYLQAAKAVLPHGVLEIPAVVLSAVYGLWLGMTFARRIRQRAMGGFGDQGIHGTRMFFKVAFPLFVLDAFI